MTPEQSYRPRITLYLTPAGTATYHAWHAGVHGWTHRRHGCHAPAYLLTCHAHLHMVLLTAPPQVSAPLLQHTQPRTPHIPPHHTKRSASPPGRSLTRPARTSTSECSCRLCPSPGMDALTCAVDASRYVRRRAQGVPDLHLGSGGVSPTGVPLLHTIPCPVFTPRTHDVPSSYAVCPRILRASRLIRLTLIPLLSCTRATLRFAEFGFLGAVVYTRTQMPRLQGLPWSARYLTYMCASMHAYMHAY